MKSAKAELGQIVIRPPEGMRERIRASADANGRSMNSEIIAALEQYFRLEEAREAGWRWVEPKHQIDAGLLGELEAIERDPEGGVPTSVSINSAISRYVAEYFGDGRNDDGEDAEITSGSLATKEDLAALREEISNRIGSIEQLLIELTKKRS